MNICILKKICTNLKEAHLSLFLVYALLWDLSEKLLE